MAWAKDGSGFFYARFPEPRQGTASQANVENHAVYFHAIARNAPYTGSAGLCNSRPADHAAILERQS
ncbi:hypothetical protein [Nostoc sp.]|uniref:hypothetical protein n=1 Tax=Nostoc sp. TaxID=1180 RepID=UPI003FA5941D